MKIAVIITRILLGLMFLFGAVAYFFNLIPVPVMTGDVKTFNMGLAASVYLFPLIKGIELICGLAFIAGRFVTLATVVIFPIMINIVLFHAFLDPANLAAPLVMLAGNLFLAYYYRKNYESLFAVK